MNTHLNSMIKSFVRGLELLLGLILYASASIHAQVNTATVSGDVKDVTGAAISSATLSLENVLTGSVRTATSDDDGRFSFSFVPIGTYALSVAHAGFQRTTLTDIHLTASMSIDLPVKLTVQDVQSTVTVSADEETLQTTTSEQQAAIPERQLNGLPVSHQNWVTVLALDPSISTEGGSSNGIAINGLPPQGYNVTVDGTNATSNPEYNSYNVYGAPNIINTVGNDAIAEISVVKGIAPATVGNTMSANINIITKSGSNQFHGSGYETNQVSLYDARNSFLTYRPRTVFNQYGGFIGGPIRRDKLFFMGSYEGAKANSLNAISGTVPSPYLHSIAPAIYASVLNLYPTIAQPSSPTALIGTYQGTATQIQKDGSGVVRFDSYLNRSNQLAVRYIRARPNLSLPSLIPINPLNYSAHTDAINANYLHIGRNWTSNLRFGFNQLKLTRINPGFNQGLNSLSFSGFGSGGAYKAFIQHGNFTTYEETVGLTRGNHTFQFGGIVQRQNASRYLVQTPGVTFASLSDFMADIPSTTTLALYSVPPGQPPFGFINYMYGAYAQDDYRVSNKLTLNLGIRYDYFTVPQEYAGRFYNRGVDPANSQLGAGFGPYRPADSIYNANSKGAQPRVGFAWQVRRDTVVHGGVGILMMGQNFYSGPVSLTQVSPTLPFTQIINRSQALSAGLKYPLVPSAYAQEVSALQASGILSSNLANVTTVPAHNPNPYSIERFLGIQQELPWGVDVTIDYVGNVGVQLGRYETKNLANRLTGVSPVPSFASFTQNSVGDHSRYNALQTEAVKRLSHGLEVGVSYAWSNTLAYGDAGTLQPSQPQDPDNFKAEFGPSTYDVRQRFKAHGVWNLPINTLVKADRIASRELVNGWQISAIYTGETGLPANILNSSSSYPSDRPDPVAGVPVYVSGYRPFPSNHQYLNPKAFAQVPLNVLSGAQIRGGYLRRNAVRLPGLEQLDATVSKTLEIAENVNFILRLDAFNAFNHNNLGGLTANVSASNFGRLTSSTPRTVQISGRFTF